MCSTVSSMLSGLKMFRRDNFNFTKLMLFDTEAAFLDLNLSIHFNTVLQTYDISYMINGRIVNFLLRDGDVPRCPSYGVIYLSVFALPEHLCMLMTSIIVTNA